MHSLFYDINRIINIFSHLDSVGLMTIYMRVEQHIFGSALQLRWQLQICNGNTAHGMWVSPSDRRIIIMNRIDAQKFAHHDDH